MHCVTAGHKLHADDTARAVTGAGEWQDENRPLVDLCSGRSAGGQRRRSRLLVCLLVRSQGRTTAAQQTTDGIASVDFSSLCHSTFKRQACGIALRTELRGESPKAKAQEHGRLSAAWER